MRDRTTPLAVALGLALAGLACGGPETGVVNRYFTALNTNDTTTLSGFASVTLDQKVDSWKIVSASDETRGQATLPDLVAKLGELEAALEETTKEYRAWGNDIEIYPKLERVRTLRKDEKKIPKSLLPIEETWDGFNAKRDELKAGVADAKEAVNTETRNARLSVGAREAIETLAGEVVSKTVALDLTIDGQVQPYTMGLRKYELQDDGSGARMTSRWVVYSLDPTS
jgi:hypothetical protein